MFTVLIEVRIKKLRVHHVIVEENPQKMNYCFSSWNKIKKMCTCVEVEYHLSPTLLFLLRFNYFHLLSDSDSGFGVHINHCELM